MKQLWAYIRKNNLQDPSNKRKIICNDELRLVFETDCTDMFKMNKLLAKHIIPLESTSKPSPLLSREDGGERRGLGGVHIYNPAKSYTNMNCRFQDVPIGNAFSCKNTLILSLGVMEFIGAVGFVLQMIIYSTSICT